MMYVSARSILLPLFRKKIAEIIGREFLPPSPPYLLAANHVDYLDGFFISAAVFAERKQAVYFITKSSNYWWTRATIPIDQNKRSESIDDAFGYLRGGKVICNFVEGSRNPERYLLKGRTGTARLALVANVPVIPVGVAGPSGKNFMQSLTNLFTDRGDVTVRFGPPVPLDEFRLRQLDYDTLNQATDRIMQALVPLTGKVYAG